VAPLTTDNKDTYLNRHIEKSIAISSLLNVGLKKFKEGLTLDALAFFESVICEYGANALVEPELTHARKKVLNLLNMDRPITQFEYPQRHHIDIACDCALCGSTDHYFFEQYANKNWIFCSECKLLSYHPDPLEAFKLNQGESAGAKASKESLVHHREYFFCNLFIEQLSWQNVLLYGAGWSLVPQWLAEKGINAMGCDLWQPLIEERRKLCGDDKYCHRDELPNKTFQLISAFEVFEHFMNPKKDVGLLVQHLSDEGAIIGCTDFWHGGSLENHPSSDKTYWKHRTHVTAWSFPSMRYLAKVFDLSVSFFKVDTPGFGAKVFFVFYRGESVATFVESLPKVFHNAF
jgi:hypothetical protein